MFWSSLASECGSLTSSEPDEIANMANVSALMFSTLNEKKNNTINWLGFYRVGAADQETLVLGPFQGKVACIRIPFGQGVCGACAKTKVLQLVPDVDNFPGHIACDSNSRSFSAP